MTAGLTEVSCSAEVLYLGLNLRLRNFYCVNILNMTKLVKRFNKLSERMVPARDD